MTQQQTSFQTNINFQESEKQNHTHLQSQRKDIQNVTLWTFLLHENL